MVLALAGCGIYRPDVRQGNYIDQTVVGQLRPGMSKEQVQFLLGTPLLVDPFRQDRWDYVYRFQPGAGGEIEQRRVSLFFQGDSLSRIEPGAGL
jgi:outer membrane protein assembly factor BamE